MTTATAQVFGETALGNRYGFYTETNEAGKKDGISLRFCIAADYSLTVNHGYVFENGTPKEPFTGKVPEKALKTIANAM